MNTIEIVLYIAAMLASAASWSYLDGRAKHRFATNEIQSRPPYVLGIVTAPVWPLQLFGVLFWATVYAPHRVGEKRSLASDEELQRLRKQNKMQAQEAARIFRQIGAGADPATKEGLLAISAGTVSFNKKEADEELWRPEGTDKEALLDLLEPYVEPEILDKHNNTVGEQ